MCFLTTIESSWSPTRGGVGRDSQISQFCPSPLVLIRSDWPGGLDAAARQGRYLKLSTVRRSNGPVWAGATG